MSSMPIAFVMHRQLALAAFLWLAIILISLFVRPLFPIDETRYLSVAWEMWTHKEWLVPHLNGQTYAHKPPLYFWLIHVGWAAMGVSEWWPRLLPILFAAGNVLLTGALARRLWPQEQLIAEKSILVLIGISYWAVYSTMAMFDMFVVFFVLTGVWGILDLCDAETRRRGLVILALSVGLGALAKGPFTPMYLAIIVLAAPLWHRTKLRPGQWLKWYGFAALAGLGGVMLVLAWLVPALQAGGDAYAHEILWKQTAGRAVQAFRHARPFWWYFALLPLLLLPWSFWKHLYAVLWRRSMLANKNVRLLLIWMLAPVLLLSLASGKQIHYLLPSFPAFALFLAYAFSTLKLEEGTHLRFRGVALSALLLGLAMVWCLWGGNAKISVYARQLGPLSYLALIATLLLIPWLWKTRCYDSNHAVGRVGIIGLALGLNALLFIWPVFPRFDMRPVAAKIAAFEHQKKPIAYAGIYHGEYHFLGRLERPITVFEQRRDLFAWSKKHPDGIILFTIRSGASLGKNCRPLLRHPYLHKESIGIAAAQARQCLHAG